MNNQLVRQRLDLLINLGHNLMATQDLKLLLNRSLQQVLAFAEHDSGSIMLYDEQNDTLEVWAALGEDTVAVGTRVANMQRSVAGHVLRECRPLVLTGYGESIGTTWRDYTRDIPSVICLPLLLPEGHSIGVLSLKSTTVPRSIDDEDIDTLQLLASQIAAVIDNARLHIERNQLVARLATSERQLRELLGRMLNAQEEERRRLAYEIHDGLAQMAASAYQHLQNVASHYRPRNLQIRSNLAQALDLMRRTIKEARSLMAGLRPAALDDLGLVVALRLEVEQLQAEGWQVRFEEDSSVGRLLPAVETALFRAAQEALTNIRKHAGITRVVVTLRRRGELAQLIVSDAGRGYNPSLAGGSPGEHLGIIGMQERALLLGGHCDVKWGPEVGTVVTVEIPVSGPETAQQGDFHGQSM
jgi:signal transduction histidine kinase